MIFHSAGGKAVGRGTNQREYANAECAADVYVIVIQSGSSHHQRRGKCINGSYSDLWAYRLTGILTNFI